MLIWVTLGGQQFEWWSSTTLYMVGGSVLMLVLAIIAEAQSKEPILPLWLFRNRTFVLSSLASVAVGIAMFGTSVFLSQYMQLARDKSPTETGLLTIPMAVGSFISATLVGRVISRTGRWKRWMVLGGVLLTAGVALMSTIDYQTSGIEQQLEMAGDRPLEEGVPAGVAVAAPSEPVLVGSVATAGNGQAAPGRANGAHKLEAAFDVVDGLGGDNGSARGEHGEHGERGVVHGVVDGEHGVVHGEVRRADGTPVGDAALTLIDSGGRQAGRATTAPDGTYQLAAAGPGSYVLIVSASSTQPQAATVTIDGRPTRFDVVLAGVTGLAGVVRTHGLNRPVPDATAVLANERGDIVASQVTREDGAYRFEHLAAGVYTLAVRAERHQPVALRLTVPDTGDLRQDVALAGGARLRGMATTAGGRPVSDAQVSVYDALRNLLDAVVTDERGGYAFAQLPPGEYTVVVTGYPPVSTTVRVEAGQSIEHDVELGYPER